MKIFWAMFLGGLFLAGAAFSFSVIATPGPVPLAQIQQIDLTVREKKLAECVNACALFVVNPSAAATCARGCATALGFDEKPVAKIGYDYKKRLDEIGQQISRPPHPCRKNVYKPGTGSKKIARYAAKRKRTIISLMCHAIPSFTRHIIITKFLQAA